MSFSYQRSSYTFHKTSCSTPNTAPESKHLDLSCERRSRSSMKWVWTLCGLPDTCKVTSYLAHMIDLAMF
jgi:hypothetical protein